MFYYIEYKGKNCIFFNYLIFNWCKGILIFIRKWKRLFLFGCVLFKVECFLKNILWIVKILEYDLLIKEGIMFLFILNEFFGGFYEELRNLF